MIKILNLFLLLSIVYSCEKFQSEDATIYVYKTKNDYSNNVSVELSEDKTRITSASGSINTRWPVKLVQGYCLNGSMGKNSGYISLTIEEYNNYEIIPCDDTLFKLLIDKDPFIEFYYRNDDDSKFYDKNGAYGIDTAFINDLIIKDELDIYFERLK